jgi:hypothetical protein
VAYLAGREYRCFSNQVIVTNIFYMSGISQLDLRQETGAGELAPDHVDQLSLGNFSPKHKYIVLKRDIRRRLVAHGAMMEEWSDKIIWLWECCQPLSNRGYISDWEKMIVNIRAGNPIEAETLAGVEEEMEETVLAVELDDGEDATDGDLMSATEAG